MSTAIGATAVSQSAVPSHLVPRVVGRILSFGLYGVALAVATRYFISEGCRSDCVVTRLYILFIMLMTTLATLALAIDTISIAVAQDRALSFFNEIRLDIILYKVAYFVVILCTQAFLARRAYSLAVRANGPPFQKPAWRKPSVLVLITVVPLMMIVSTIGYVGDLVTDVEQSHGLAYPTDLLGVHGFTIATLASAITDVTISASLSWRIVKWLRDDEGFGHRISSLLRLLLVVTAGAALFTALPAIVAAVLSVISTTPVGVTEASLLMIISDPLPQLYSISLFTTLNVRQTMRNRQSFQPTLPKPPTLPQVGAPVSTQHAPQESLRSKAADGNRLEVQLESGGFRIATVEYRNRGVVG